MFQSTLARPITFTGVGLHSGRDVQIKLQPASVDTGLEFYVHTQKGTRRMKPNPGLVSATALATTLSDGSASVSTVEHLLAALSAMRIDNVQVHVFGAEVPILDGSAILFVQDIEKAGRRLQNAPRKVARLRKPISVAGEGKAIHARPYQGFFVDYTIDFAHPSIGRQHLAMEITPDTFDAIARARTFGFAQEVEYLHSKGLALGGSLRNAVVLDDEGVVNPEGLRCADEFVRHKMLDFIGDMAMFGMPLEGAFEVHCSGHSFNNQFIRRLEAEAGQLLDIVELPVPAQPVAHTVPQAVQDAARAAFGEAQVFARGFVSAS